MSIKHSLTIIPNKLGGFTFFFWFQYSFYYFYCPKVFVPFLTMYAYSCINKITRTYKIDASLKFQRYYVTNVLRYMIVRDVG